ncbi:Dam family site-specific DNA-(adenine-N6)-methyltransferase [Variovorax sp. KK3]|uniref:Dam family site-specific DNA-(adenine-N6)-methyltransferase n=1 Tax=Variovorax sp. KK3 TaxID=1855728 RepID=UPI00097CA43E|nr:Dam family site-specific DNA-(adenine-N6)-methyltransferase [Variovorax sp. KK3]
MHQNSTPAFFGVPPASFLAASNQNRGPFFKWTGGKSKLLSQLLPLLPEGKRLIEPFVGAGSVFLSTNYERYVIGDTNEDLIAVYAALQNRPEEFISRAQQFFVEDNLTKDAYLNIRAEFNSLSDRFERAVRFPFLNRHCFNGLFRTNNSGEFNVPYSYPRRVPDLHIEEMLAAASKLQSTIILNGGFEGTLEMAGPGDVVYCDPPYLDSADGKSFIHYGSARFDASKHKRLVECCVEASTRGATVLISNHDTAETRELYYGWHINELKVRRSVAAKSEARRMASELVAALPAAGKHLDVVDTVTRSNDRQILSKEVATAIAERETTCADAVATALPNAGDRKPAIAEVFADMPSKHGKEVEFQFPKKDQPRQDAAANIGPRSVEFPSAINGAPSVPGPSFVRRQPAHRGALRLSRICSIPTEPELELTQTYLQVQKQIQSLQRKAEKLRMHEMRGVIDRIKVAIAEYGITAQQLGFGSTSKPALATQTPAISQGATKAKYANGRGQIWGGMGPRPAWLRAELEAGNSLEDFLVTVRRGTFRSA